MLIKFAGAGLALSLALLTGTVASAQTTTAQDNYAARAHREGTVAGARQAFETGRINDRLRGSRRSGRTEVQIGLATREALTKAGVTCELTGSSEIGEIENGGYLYEAACAGGPGYLVTSGDTSEAYDCLQLASSLERNPVADGETATKCALPANQDRAAMIAPIARAAGISCQVDNAIYLGLTGDQKARYEIGCSGSDGYWVDADSSGAAVKTSCLTVTANRGECTYTTPEEQLATIRTRFATANKPGCTVDQGRGVGATPTNEYYEVKCAEGPGFMVRTSLGGEVEQVYACEQADSIAGGCKLTDLSDVRATLSERRKAQLSSAGVTCTSTAELKIGQERGQDGREVIEFTCAEVPLGLVAYLPPQGNEDVLVQDCITATMRGISCRSTSAETLQTALTASLRAGGTECAVTQFKARASLGEGVGDSVEVKCSDGSGYVADVPANRAAPSAARACVGLPASEQCTL